MVQSRKCGKIAALMQALHFEVVAVDACCRCLLSVYRHDCCQRQFRVAIPCDHSVILLYNLSRILSETMLRSIAYTLTCLCMSAPTICRKQHDASIPILDSDHEGLTVLVLQPVAPTTLLTNFQNTETNTSLLV